MQIFLSFFCTFYAGEQYIHFFEHHVHLLNKIFKKLKIIFNKIIAYRNKKPVSLCYEK